MATPSVSVLIDTYNHERFIEQAIVSVLEQDFPSSEREILVVDDGSTDNTAALVEKFRPQVRYLRKANGGQASAFNAGIPEARGKIVAFLDGDDWWAKDKLSTVLEVMAKNPEVGAVGHGYYEAHDGVLPPRTVVPKARYRLHLGDVDTARLFSSLRGFLGTSKMTIRKSILDRVLPIPEGLVIEADEYVFTLAPAIADAIVLDRPLFHYRFHSNNLFHFQSNDPSKRRRKYNVLKVLLRTLPPRLAELGVSREVVTEVLEPLSVDAARMGLSLDGGKPWHTFVAERAAFRLSYQRASVGYRLFKGAVLALTLLLPPRRFYRLRDFYAANGLRKLRNVLGEPTTAAPVREQTTEA